MVILSIIDIFRKWFVSSAMQCIFGVSLNDLRMRFALNFVENLENLF